MFIDDEAEITHINISATSKAHNDFSSSSSDGDDDFDSSFINDVDKSTSITKQYLQSVKYVH